MKGRDLLRGGAGQQRRAKRLALEPVHLALVPGADDDGAVGVEGEIVRRVFS
jgi:hypothetical protein